MKKYAIIVAGGSGLRMGTELPKQFLEIHGKSLLSYSIEVFLRAFPDLEVIVVLPVGYEMMGKDIIVQVKAKKPIQSISGGNTRFHSVQKGLAMVENDSVIFIHDAVRCLVTEDLIRRCFDEAVQFGSAVPCIDSKDSLRKIEGEKNRAIKRKEIKLLQTPQTFVAKIVIPSYQKDYSEDFTDCASVVEYSGFPIHLIDGEIENLKITTPLDLMLAEKILSGRS